MFLGSGLLFLAMVFQAAVNANSLLEVLAKPRLATDLWDFGHGSTQVLISVYAMRMAAVFTLSVSTVGMRASAFPRWLALLGYAVALVLLLGAGEHRWVQLAFPFVGAAAQRRHPPHAPGGTGEVTDRAHPSPRR